MVLGGDPEAEELQGALQGDAWLVMSGALGCYSGLAGQAKLIYIYPARFWVPKFQTPILIAPVLVDRSNEEEKQINLWLEYEYVSLFSHRKQEINRLAS